MESTDAKQDTLTLSFTSETPVQRTFGMEVLSYKDSAVNLKRFNNSAPVLWSHDPTQQVGVIIEHGYNIKGYMQKIDEVILKKPKKLVDI